MNITQRLLAWNQFKFQLPMIICAVFVIVSQRKLIWNTLKIWWSWGLADWPSERINFMIMLVVGIVVLVFSSLANRAWKQEIVEKQQQEVVAKMLEERVITQEQLDKGQKEAAERERERRPQEVKKEPVSIYFLNFAFIVILAPIIEECVFRYLIFEIFSKDNPLAYIFSGLSFIFLHWLGPTLGVGGGLLNFTTIKFLLLTYLPMAIFLIWVYRKSKWNITYPIYFHFLWNLIAFLLGFRLLS